MPLAPSRENGNIHVLYKGLVQNILDRNVYLELVINLQELISLERKEHFVYIINKGHFWLSDIAFTTKGLRL